ncbi:MAG: DUF1622 domain-containing protein [marine benthic group bacterium]|nr:DUF1622 domain-containing protein [Gemmatimonadota bacterium]
MPEEVRQLLSLVVASLEIAGAGALILGFLVATYHCVRRGVRKGARPAIARYRKALGRVTLIGLEILVAATIIKTITLDPTLRSAGILAIAIVIRTALSWTTVLEVYGHWPWRRSPATQEA